MGTGIVANAAVLLPGHLPGLRPFALAAWTAAAAWLIVLTTVAAAHRLRGQGRVIDHALDPAMAPFLGAHRWRC